MVEIVRANLGVDRVSVFSYDADDDELMLLLSNDAKNVQLPKETTHRGIVGHIISTGEEVVIEDAQREQASRELRICYEHAMPSR